MEYERRQMNSSKQSSGPAKGLAEFDNMGREPSRGTEAEEKVALCSSSALTMTACW
jgi:hypothetical protein